jgi:hypothetical protein
VGRRCARRPGDFLAHGALYPTATVPGDQERLAGPIYRCLIVTTIVIALSAGEPAGRLAVDTQLLRLVFPAQTGGQRPTQRRVGQCGNRPRHGELRSLISLAVIVSLIASTRTAAGLRVRAELDQRRYPAGQEVPEELMSSIKLRPHRFHGDWNYTIHPNRKPS